MKIGSAHFSRCGKYRYLLTRSVSQQLAPPTVTFVMLNPAQADARKNDQTIGKCVGFAERWGMKSLQVINLYAFCTSYQNELYAADDPIGPMNQKWLRKVLRRSDKVVCAWGKGVSPKRAKAFQKLSDEFQISLHCLGTNLDGSPKHPARIGYKAKLITYEIRYNDK